MRKCLAVAALLATGSAAFAQDAAAVFAALDADRNGSVSQMEAQRNSTVAANFVAADTDNNGSLSRDEFIAAFGQS